MRARVPERGEKETLMTSAFSTPFLLMAQYGGRAVIPVEDVCRDYFRHMTPEHFVRRVSAGEINLPLVRMDKGPKCAKGVALVDLAAYLDRQMAAARKEAAALCG